VVILSELEWHISYQYVEKQSMCSCAPILERSEVTLQLIGPVWCMGSIFAKFCNKFSTY